MPKIKRKTHRKKETNQSPVVEKYLFGFEKVFLRLLCRSGARVKQPI